MVDHRATQIVARLADQINLGTQADQHVYRNHPGPLPAVPYAVNLVTGPDEIQQIHNQLVDSWLTVYVDLYSSTAGPQPPEGFSLPAYDAFISELRKETHIAIMKDITLNGLGFIIDIETLGADELQVNNEGEEVQASMRTAWRFLYRSSTIDPSL